MTLLNWQIHFCIKNIAVTCCKETWAVQLGDASTAQTSLQHHIIHGAESPEILSSCFETTISMDFKHYLKTFLSKRALFRHIYRSKPPLGRPKVGRFCSSQHWREDLIRKAPRVTAGLGKAGLTRVSTRKKICLVWRPGVQKASQKVTRSLS